MEDTPERRSSLDPSGHTGGQRHTLGQVVFCERKRDETPGFVNLEAGVRCRGQATSQFKKVA